MITWICQFCGNILRGRPHRPAYCARCGLGKFRMLGAQEGSASGRTTVAFHESRSVSDAQLRSFKVISDTPAKPGRERRRAKRVRPKAHLQVRLCHVAFVEAVDISVIGLLVEHETPFKPGSVCEVELGRHGETVQLRGEVVRTFLTKGDGSQNGVRYRTAIQFHESPPAIFRLLPELSEDSLERPVTAPAPD